MKIENVQSYTLHSELYSVALCWKWSYVPYFHAGHHILGDQVKGDEKVIVVLDKSQLTNTQHQKKCTTQGWQRDLQ